jgi:hypothetical protein
MKTDLYTKSVLTVIAAALVLLVLQHTDFTNEAKASGKDFNSFASVPVNEDGSINVRMMSDMDVNIHSIGGSSVYGALPVNLREISGSSVNSGGIPVNIESVDGMSVYSAIPVKEQK